ncbi:MAG: hypothetical protein HYX63_00280 [Gammaproteobacteria bacterium]|nr:hypothetical protein [Gammaproteobacteria bacterium]
MANSHAGEEAIAESTESRANVNVKIATLLGGSLLIVCLLIIGLMFLRKHFITLANQISAVRTEVTAVRTEVTAVRTEVTAVRTEVAAVRTEVAAVGAEIVGVRAEVAAVKTAIPPPLYEARHLQVRKSFIYWQAAQMEEAYSLVVGDSITEGLYLPKLDGALVVNGGMGGAGVSSVEELLNEYPAQPKLKVIVIAIGVNDATRRELPITYFTDWEKSYGTVLTRAKMLATRVAISTIIPVETGKSLGDRYFDPSAIAHMNSVIRQQAMKSGATLIDNDKSFEALTEQGHSYTLDGVHLNAKGYRVWKSNIQSAFSASQ